MSAQPNLSVILCAHNPRAAYLERTLAALAAQTLAAKEWEFVLVDNASAPPLTAATLAPLPTSARLVREMRLGLTPARLRGIYETSAEVIVFVDDDNVLAPDYLANALELARAWPMLGTWGGQIVPEFEVQPPEWTRPYWKALALRDVPQDCWSNLPGDAHAEPFGAGLCVRRVVAEHYAHALINDHRRRALGRSGAQLTSGEDSDLAWTACDLGFGNGVFARLKLTHLIPASRLEEGYLLRLVEALSYSKVMLDASHGHRPSRPSRSQRLFDYYCHLHVSARERRFLQAKARGRDRALDELEAAGS